MEFMMRVINSILNALVCKNNFRAREEITVLPCGHVFHKNCVYNWFISNKTCPEDGTVVLN